MSEQDRHGVDADAETAQIDGIENDIPGPSLDGLMEELSRQFGISGQGWAGIDSNPKAMTKQRQESAAAMKAEANIFRDTFMTDAGRRCLELMIDQTLHARPYPADAQLPMDAITPLVIAHDAQCSFVWGILDAIAQAENRATRS